MDMFNRGQIYCQFLFFLIKVMLKVITNFLSERLDV